MIFLYYMVGYKPSFILKSLLSFSNLTVQSNTFWKDSIKAGIASCGWMFWLVSFESDVTPLPSIPQGVKCSNQLRSLLQFSAIPWVVIQRLVWTPVNANKKEPLVLTSHQLIISSMGSNYKTVPSEKCTCRSKCPKKKCPGQNAAGDFYLE